MAGWALGLEESVALIRVMVRDFVSCHLAWLPWIPCLFEAKALGVFGTSLGIGLLQGSHMKNRSLVMSDAGGGRQQASVEISNQDSLF